MIGITQAHVDIILKTQMVFHDRKRETAVQLSERHVSRQEESLRGNLVAVIIDKTSPLLTIKAQNIDSFAHTRKTCIGVSVGIGIVGEDGRLLGFRDGNGSQHHDKDKGYMCDFHLQIGQNYYD